MPRKRAPVTPEEAYRYRSAGGYSKAATYPREQLTKAATRGWMAKLEDKVDPTGELRQLDPSEFQRRFKAALGLHMQQVSLAKIRGKAEHEAHCAAVAPCAWCLDKRGQLAKLARNVSLSICPKHVALFKRAATIARKKRGMPHALWLLATQQEHTTAAA